MRMHGGHHAFLHVCTIGEKSLIVGAARGPEAGAIERIRWSARNHVENWKRFERGIKRLGRAASI
jgi:hypothetical protein